MFRCIMNRGKNRKITLEQVFDIDNLKLAVKNAMKGKPHHYSIRKFMKHYDENIQKLHDCLKDRTFKVGKPHLETMLCDRKVRTLAKVHFENHVVFHALMQIVMPVLEKQIYIDASSSLKGKGIHYTVRRLKNYINRHRKDTLYYTLIDYTKYYHHINRRILYNQICKLFNNEGVRYLFKEIIYSLGKHNGLYESTGEEGLGIGMYPSQTLINLYLKDQDYYVTTLKVRLFRYCDNILIISTEIANIKQGSRYIIDNSYKIQSPIHENIGIQKLDDKHNPIDFVGYKFYKTYIKLRDSIKYRFKYKIHHTNNLQGVLSAYKGLFKYCKARHLWNTITGLKSYNKKEIKKYILNYENTKRQQDASYKERA